MRLLNIVASAHPCGNRIDLRWVNPSSCGVRVVRREGTYPTLNEKGANPPSAAFGVVLAEEEDLENLVDENTKSETVYYYALYPYPKGKPHLTQYDRHNRAAAMATGKYSLAERLYDLLPGIYHRYDGQDKQLQRYLQLPGKQLDQIYSLARAMLDLYDLERVDGRLLPLLAEWIGWSTNYRLELNAQRNEIRNAPHLYQTAAIIPNLEAAVKRLLGWRIRTKEFNHNVFRSNCPERLTLWARERAGAGEWSQPARPLSLDFTYEGRPSAARGQAGVFWVFYHTQVSRWDEADQRWRNQWDIWYKTLSIFGINNKFQSDLDQGAIPTGMQNAFDAVGFPLSLNCVVEKKLGEWRVTDHVTDNNFTIRHEGETLKVYHWAPSRPLTRRRELDRHPTAASQGRRLWVFWDVYDEAVQKWGIDGRIQMGDESWAPCDDMPFGKGGLQRRQPVAVTDEESGLWLFWLENEEGQWQIACNRHDGSGWGEIARLPAAQENARVDDDLFVLYQSTSATEDDTPRLWVFWARRVLIDKEQFASVDQLGITSKTTRWEIVYRVKSGISNLEDGWSEVVRFRPFGDENEPIYDDREPAAYLNTKGEIELLWSSNRDGSWSIWCSKQREFRPGIKVPGTGAGVHPDSEGPGEEAEIFPDTKLERETNRWGSAHPITTAPYSQRDPLPVSLVEGFDGSKPPPGSVADLPRIVPSPRTLLLYRSNRSLPYRSHVYSATETMDGRYAGCTTADARNPGKRALWKKFEDFQTYTYDTGPKGVPTEQTWYARNTVGLYFTPDTGDLAQILRSREEIEGALRQFLPLQVRAAFILDSTDYQEPVDITISQQFSDRSTTI